MNKGTSIYKSKLVSIDDVVSQIQSNYDVVVAQAASNPQGCLAKFHLVADQVENVNVFSVLTLNNYEFFTNPSLKGKFNLCSWFHSGAYRAVQSVKSANISYVPNTLHRAALDRIQVRRPNMFIGTCTPPDKNGFVSLSLGVTYEKDILENSDLVVLEVNPRLPRTFGDTHVHVSDVTYFIEHEAPVPELAAAEPDTVEQEIGNHIASLVENGSTIQIGIGGIPAAAAQALRDKRDLGVHTEMFVDPMVDLFEMGVITNKAKAFNKGKFITTFALGTKKLYDWLDNNPAVEFKRGCWVNDPSTLRQNSKMVSVNTCFMVDLTGQVSSESLGFNHYSGTGGQADTAIGAVEGLDGKGKSIIACRSTAKCETISTIVPLLPEGSAVTLHRGNVDYVVTEFGIAHLRGRTVSERTRSLISIAHPKFRDQLLNDARKFGYI